MRIELLLLIFAICGVFGMYIRATNKKMAKLENMVKDSSVRIRRQDEEIQEMDKRENYYNLKISELNSKNNEYEEFIKSVSTNTTSEMRSISEGFSVDTNKVENKKEEEEIKEEPLTEEVPEVVVKTPSNGTKGFFIKFRD